MPDKSLLRIYQALPLTAKVQMSKNRIKEWYDHWNGDVYVSFSGGKDSTVLAHLVRSTYKEVPLVFANTGLEYPEIQSFARKMGAEFIRPKLAFSEVISKYGYPLIGKEVSECIYYARGHIGRENKRRQTQLTGTYHADARRLMLKGDYQEGRLNGDVVNRAMLNGKYTGSRKLQHEKVSSGDKTEKTNSQFNKTKWLPLCMETQFLIGAGCCKAMEKTPFATYGRRTGRKPYIGILTEESRLREQAWVRHGCNAFDSKKPSSQPMSFWSEQDVLHYIKNNGLEIASVYGEILYTDPDGLQYDSLVDCGQKLRCSGCQRTGCIFCGYGAYLDSGKKSRFQLLAETHPRQYEYCMRGGQWVDNPKYDPTAPAYDGDWKNWNPKKIWVPSKEGLGMKKVFDDCNAIYGKNFIRYE